MSRVSGELPIAMQCGVGHGNSGDIWLRAALDVNSGGGWQ